MIIEVYADIVSERAYLVRRQLPELLKRLAEDGGTVPQVVWRPVLVDPTAPSPSTDLTATDDLGLSLTAKVPVGEAGISEVDVASLAAGPGLGVRFDPRWRASSWAAHRMVTAALEHGPAVQDEVVEVVMTAHFRDGTDINDAAFLRSLAARFELPPPVVPAGSASALTYLQPGVAPDDAVERATREALLLGRAIGVTVSPSFVVDDQVVFADSGPWPARLTDALPGPIAALTASSTTPPPPEVRRFRAARALLEARDPRGSLYLLAPLQAEYAGERDVALLTARTLVASASLEPARVLLEDLVEAYPDDAHLHLLLGRTLQRLHDPRADRHLALAAAMDPDAVG